VSFLPGTGIPTDIVEGSCGFKHPAHECNFEFELKVGETHADFEKLVKNGVKSSHLMSIIMVPLHLLLPPLPVGLYSVCNKFNTSAVMKDWKSWLYLLQTHCKQFRVVIFSTDGDSRRSAIANYHLFRETSAGESDNEFSIKFPSFPPSFEYMGSESNKSCVCYGFGDPKHISKCFINHLNQSGRVLTFGEGPITINMLNLVRQLFPYERHKLLVTDIDGSDRQDVYRVCKMASLRVEACLKEINSGISTNSGTIQAPTESLMAYLYILRCYLKIFFSEQDDALQRVENATFCYTVFRYWRVSVSEKKALVTQFFSKQTYLAFQRSCFQSILAIKAMNVFTPNIDLRYGMSHLGSDNNEGYFRDVGGNGVMNKNHRKSWSATFAREFAENYLQLKARECGAYKSHSNVGRSESAGVAFNSKTNRKHEMRSDCLEEEKHLRPLLNAVCATEANIISSMTEGEKKAKLFLEKHKIEHLGLDIKLENDEIEL
jgi:hypothetical protein